MLHDCNNPYINGFKHMLDLSRQLLHDGVADVSLGFRAATSEDPRRYNHPAVSEVAAIFSGADGAPPANRDIRVWPRDEDVYQLPDENEHIDPLTYVLLFPDGLCGWHESLLHSEGKRTARYQRLTATQFYSHRLMVFDTENPLPHGAGFLFQQYVVDA